MLCEKLTPFMRKWVVDAEMKKMKNIPVVELVLREGLTLENVRITVTKWTGSSPKKSKGMGEMCSWCSSRKRVLPKNYWK